MVRQDAEVQHVRIGEHQIGVVPDPAAGTLVSIAVVCFGTDRPQPQGVHGSELIGRQRLSGCQVECGRARRFQGGPVIQPRAVDRIQHRELVRQGLAGSGTRGNDRVLPAVGSLGRLNLVLPGQSDTQPCVRIDHIGMGPRGPRRLHGLAGRDLVDVDQLRRFGSTAQQRDQGIM